MTSLYLPTLRRANCENTATHRRTRRGRAVATAMLLLTLSACTLLTEPTSPLRALRGRGPVPVQLDSAYLTSTRLIVEEQARDPQFKALIDRLGVPPLLEVRGSLLTGLLSGNELVLHYPSRAESMVLYKQDDQWVVTGPFPWGPEERARLIGFPNTDTSVTSSLSALEQDRSTTPIGGSFQSSTSAKITTPRSVSGSTPPTLESTLPSEYEALKALAENAASPPAELTPRGDLVHYVTYPGETLSAIARWYTFDASNALRLARINGIPSPVTLTAGDEVVIPRYLVRNQKRLTEAVLAELAKLEKLSAARPRIPKVDY